MIGSEAFEAIWGRKKKKAVYMKELGVGLHDLMRSLPNLCNSMDFMKEKTRGKKHISAQARHP